MSLISSVAAGEIKPAISLIETASQPSHSNSAATLADLPVVSIGLIAPRLKREEACLTGSTVVVSVSLAHILVATSD